MPKLSGDREWLSNDNDNGKTPHPSPGYDLPNPTLSYQLTDITPANFTDESFIPEEDVGDLVQGLVSASAASSSSSSSSFTSMSFSPKPSPAPQKVEVEDLRLSLALEKYSSKSSALMKGCMITAGFSSKETEESDGMYHKFVEKALENEKLRLEKIKSRASASLLAGRNSDSLPLTSSAALHFPTGENSETNQSVQPRSMVQALSKPILPNEVISSTFANNSSSSDNDILDLSSLSHLQAMAAIEQDCGSFNIRNPCQSSLAHNNSIMSRAAGGWISNGNLSTDTNRDYNPLIVDLPANLDFGNSENTNGPEVLDLKHVNLYGEEWKTILQKTEHKRSEF